MTPRTKEQFEEMRGQSRQKILGKALELFAKNGYYGTTISKIAKASGVSQGLMYNYFSSKDDLLEAVVYNGIEEMHKMIVSLTEGKSPQELLRTLFEFSFSPEVLKDDTFKLYFSVLLQPHTLEAMHSVIYNQLEKITFLMEDVLRKCEIENPEIEARILGAMLDGIGLHFWFGGDSYPIEEIKSVLINRYCK